MNSKRPETKHPCSDQPADLAPLNSKRVWIYRLIALVVIPLLLILLVEVGLKIVGFGYNPHFLIKMRKDGKLAYASNPKAGWRFLGRDLAREPFPFCVPAEKSSNTVRIVIFGESAAYGDPHPQVGLARMLQAILEYRHPETHFEVINAAMTGINTHAIRLIAKDCTALKADVWVLYIGNNEVIGPFGPGTVFTTRMPPLWLVRLVTWAKGTRLGQCMESISLVLQPKTASKRQWLGLMMFANSKLHPLDFKLQITQKWFDKNLTEIINTALDSGASVVVSTVGVNLLDCAPFASLHKPDLTPEDLNRWTNFFEKGKSAEKREDWQGAMEAYNAAISIDDTFAELRYRRGLCALALGLTNLAVEELTAACDFDALQFRCSSRFNELTKQIARRYDHRRVILVDTKSALTQLSPRGIPDSTLFYEHVHLTVEGTYIVATNIAQAVEAIISQKGLLHPHNSDWPSFEECVFRLGWTDFDKISTLSDMLMRISDPPFIWQCNHEQHRQKLVAKTQLLISLGHHAIVSNSLAQVESALSKWPFDPVLLQRAAIIRQAAGDTDAAISALQKHIEIVPVSVDGLRMLAIAYLRKGLTRAAIKATSTALTLNERDIWTLRLLAQCQLQAGQTNSAMKTLWKAVRINPVFGPAWLDLAKIYESRGETNRATELYRYALTNRVLRPAELLQLARTCVQKGWLDKAIQNYTDLILLKPADPELRIEAARALSLAGRHREAIENLQIALTLNPNSGVARYLLGLELGRVGQHVQAAEQFNEACRIMPDLPEAYFNLGIALMNAGENKRALEVFESVLSRWPTNQLAREKIQLLRAVLNPPPGTNLSHPEN